MDRVIVLLDSYNAYAAQAHRDAFRQHPVTCHVVDNVGRLISEIHGQPIPKLAVCDAQWMTARNRSMLIPLESREGKPPRSPREMGGMSFGGDWGHRTADTPVIAIYDGPIEALQAECPQMNIIAVISRRDVHDTPKYSAMADAFFRSEKHPHRGVVTQETFEEARRSTAAHAGIAGLQGQRYANTGRPQAIR